MKIQTNTIKRLISIILTAFIAVTSVGVQPVNASSSLAKKTYNGTAVVRINKNKPKFKKKQKKLKKPKVKYSRLDKYGRCGKVTAVLSRKKLAKGTRGSIGMYKPSGWPVKIGNAR